MFYGITCNYKKAIEVSENYSVIELNLSKEDFSNFSELDSIIFVSSKKNNNFFLVDEEYNFLIKQKNIGGLIIQLPKSYRKSREEELEDIVFKIKKLMEKYIGIKIIIETNSEITQIGSKLSDLIYISKKLPEISFCIDTMNLFLSGHPINKAEYFFTYLLDFEINIGLEKISLFRLKDTNAFFFESDAKHTNIFEGKLFRNEYVLFFLKTVSEIYNIPMVFHEETSSLEIEKIELIKTEKENFIFLLKNSILIFYLNELIKYYEFTNKSYSVFEELKDIVIKSFDNEEFLINGKNDNFLLTYDIIYKDEFEKILNKKYDSFDFLLKDNFYLEKIKMLETDFFDKLFVDKLFSNHITNLVSLKSLDTKEKKKFFTPTQIKMLKKFDYVREMDFDTVDEFLKKIKNCFEDISVYGTYYRIKNDIEILTNIEKIEILCVNDSKDLLEKMKVCFDLKAEILDTNTKKINIYIFKKKYFTVEINICTEEEEVFMSLFLKSSKNMFEKISSITKSKNLELSQTFLKSNGKKLFFKTEKELCDFLEMKKKY